MQGVLKLFALNFVLTHLLNFFFVTKRVSDWHRFCKLNSAGGSFCWNLQLTLSMAIMQVTTTVAFMQVLRWYFRYWYVGGFSVAIKQVTVSVAIIS